jgi:hypothetical protein
MLIPRQISAASARDYLLRRAHLCLSVRKQDPGRLKSEVGFARVAPKHETRPQGLAGVELPEKVR